MELWLVSKVHARRTGLMTSWYSRAFRNRFVFDENALIRNGKLATNRLEWVLGERASGWKGYICPPFERGLEGDVITFEGLTSLSHSKRRKNLSIPLEYLPDLVGGVVQLPIISIVRFFVFPPRLCRLCLQLVEGRIEGNRVQLTKRVKIDTIEQIDGSR